MLICHHEPELGHNASSIMSIVALNSMFSTVANVGGHAEIWMIMWLTGSWTDGFFIHKQFENPRPDNCQTFPASKTSVWILFYIYARYIYSGLHYKK